jgi:hypothetical protein
MNAQAEMTSSVVIEVERVMRMREAQVGRGVTHIRCSGCSMWFALRARAG